MAFKSFTSNNQRLNGRNFNAVDYYTSICENIGDREFFLCNTKREIQKLVCESSDITDWVYDPKWHEIPAAEVLVVGVLSVPADFAESSSFLVPDWRNIYGTLDVLERDHG